MIVGLECITEPSNVTASTSPTHKIMLVHLKFLCESDKFITGVSGSYKSNRNRCRITNSMILLHHCNRDIPMSLKPPVFNQPHPQVLVRLN